MNINVIVSFLAFVFVVSPVLGNGNDDFDITECPFYLHNPLSLKEIQQHAGGSKPKRTFFLDRRESHPGSLLPYHGLAQTKQVQAFRSLFIRLSLDKDEEYNQAFSLLQALANSTDSNEKDTAYQCLKLLIQYNRPWCYDNLGNFLLEKLQTEDESPKNFLKKILSRKKKSKTSQPAQQPNPNIRFVQIGTQLLMNTKVGTGSANKKAEDFVTNYLKSLCESQDKDHHYVAAHVITWQLCWALGTIYREPMVDELIHWHPRYVAGLMKSNEQDKQFIGYTVLQKTVDNLTFIASEYHTTVDNILASLLSLPTQDDTVDNTLTSLPFTPTQEDQDFVTMLTEVYERNLRKNEKSIINSLKDKVLRRNDNGRNDENENHGSAASSSNENPLIQIIESIEKEYSPFPQLATQGYQ